MMDAVTTRRRAAPAEAMPVAEYALIGATFAAVLAGGAAPERAELGFIRAAGLCVVPALLAVRSYRAPSLSARRGLRTPLWVPASAALAAVVVQGGGGVAGPVGVLALLAAVAASLGTEPRRALPWAALLTACVLIPGWVGLTAAASPFAAASFAIAVLLCAALPGTALSGERRSHERTRARLRALEDESGALRSETTATLAAVQPPGEDRDRDLRTVARELQQDMDRACAVLVTATGAYAAAVYRPDGEDDWTRLLAVSRAGATSDLIAEVGARDGIFGAAFKAGAPVCLSPVRDDDPRVVHRENPSALGAVLALPLVDGERRWGVVVVDAQDPESLTGSNRELAGNIADFVARLITRAVDLSAVREDMRNNHAFYEACREVSRHVRIDDIAHAVVSSAGRFVSLDACAFALSDEAGETLRVIASAGFDPAPPKEPFFIAPTEGLLAQAVRHATTIERTDLADCSRPPVLFGKQAGPEDDLHSLLVLPVVPPGGDGRPVGAVVVARRSWPDFEPEDAERLHVLLHQVGAAVSNGRMFAESETRGVTDGMTGLPNHRRFQEVLAQKIAGAERTGLQLSLLLMDIDRFKLVNDTYGHPAGDEVIKRLAGLLGGVVREGTDLAARYGGEEFCLLLEGTDAEGAQILADRIRESFKSEAFVLNEAGKPVTFRCSVSIGISCWPDDSRNQAQLIEQADQALYVSKESGRDRATCYSARGAKNGRSSRNPTVTSPGQPHTV